MKTVTTCSDVPCDRSIAERPRYFPRQLITPDDLNLEQDYFRSKLRWHNRMLHGWGVVCGALVCLVPKSKNNGSKFEPWKVKVKPGYILGPYGDEIVLDCGRIVDLRTRGVTGITGEPCVDGTDPWCTEVSQQPDGGPLYVAVKYKAVAARPIRVQPIGCGCDDSSCENSRIVDGYEIGVLTECPDSHQNPPDLESLSQGPVPECPECPDEPWVVLAKVDVDPNGTITKIDNCACRRIVISLAGVWRECTADVLAPQPTPQPAPAEPPSANPPSRPDPGTLPAARGVSVAGIETRGAVVQGGKTEVVVKGQNLDQVASVTFEAGVNVAAFKAEKEALAATISVDPNAKPGKRTMVLLDKNGSKLFEKAQALEILAGAQQPPATDTAPTTGPAVKAATSRSQKRKKKRSSDDDEV